MDLVAAVTAEPHRDITVDLEYQTISCGNRTYGFSIDPVSRNQLLNGWDDIDLTENYRAQISAFYAADRLRRPWAAPEVNVRDLPPLTQMRPATRQQLIVFLLTCGATQVFRGGP